MNFFHHFFTHFYSISLTHPGMDRKLFCLVGGGMFNEAKKSNPPIIQIHDLQFHRVYLIPHIHHV